MEPHGANSRTTTKTGCTRAALLTSQSMDELTRFARAARLGDPAAVEPLVKEIAIPKRLVHLAPRTFPHAVVVPPPARRGRARRLAIHAIAISAPPIAKTTHEIVALDPDTGLRPVEVGLPGAERG